MNRHSGNIARLYVVKISKWFNLVMPVVVLFYQDNGMGMQEIFVLKSIYSLAIVALELPSGWMADVWGRKKTLLLGAVLGSAGFLMYSFSYGFWAFVAAEIVLGAGHSFVSGADSAMLYESLKADKKPDRYVKHEGQITSAGNFAEALAGIAAGFLAAMSLRTPFYFQFAVATLAVPAAFSLKEPVLRAATHLHKGNHIIGPQPDYTCLFCPCWSFAGLDDRPCKFENGISFGRRYLFQYCADGSLAVDKEWERLKFRH